jgi:hypothetical protein
LLIAPTPSAACVPAPVIFGCDPSFLDKPMQGHQSVVVEADQNARCATARQIGSYLPQALSHRPAQRHSHRPSPLCPQKVRSDGSALRLVQPPQPVANWLAACTIAEEYEFDLPGRFIGSRALRLQ